MSWRCRASERDHLYATISPANNVSSDRTKKSDIFHTMAAIKAAPLAIAAVARRGCLCGNPLPGEMVLFISHLQAHPAESWACPAMALLAIPVVPTRGVCRFECLLPR